MKSKASDQRAPGGQFLHLLIRKIRLYLDSACRKARRNETIGRSLVSYPQARIKHAGTDDLSQNRFGRRDGHARLLRARCGAAGAKLAAEEVNKAGGVLGRPIDLVIEDDQTTNPGIVLAFSKLAGDKDIPAFIGSVRNTQVHAMAPDIQRLGKPVMIGGTDPQLTHMGNPWLFRFRPNDIYSARVIADYGVKTLGKKKWAIVHSTDAFGTNGMKNLVEDLKGMGVEPAFVQGYTNNSQPCSG